MINLAPAGNTVPERFLKRLRSIANRLACTTLDRMARRRHIIHSNTLLLVRLDAIGDYLLFRNFLPALREQFPNSRVTFCGNIQCKDLVLAFDGQEFADFIWIERRRFMTDLRYRYAIQCDVNRRGFEVCLTATYSREILGEHAVVKASAAPRRIGFQEDGYNLGLAGDRAVADSIYTELIPAEPGVKFEFYRNREFFEKLSAQALQVFSPSLPKNARVDFPGLPSQHYALFFPGASTAQRRWSPAAYGRLAEFIDRKAKLPIVVAGSEQDREIARKIQAAAAVPLVDFTGKTTLSELAELVRGASLLVSGDTCAVHFAAAIRTPAVCISNSTWHMPRFGPYPAEMGLPIRYVFPDEIANIDDLAEVRRKYPLAKCIDVNRVPFEKVAGAVAEMLSGPPQQS